MAKSKKNLINNILTVFVVIVLSKGKIVEEGNHDELMARNGFYTKLYNSQFEED